MDLMQRSTESHFARLDLAEQEVDRRGKEYAEAQRLMDERVAKRVDAFLRWKEFPDDGDAEPLWEEYLELDRQCDLSRSDTWNRYTALMQAYERRNEIRYG